MMMKHLVLFFLFTSLLSACFYDSEEDLYGIKTCSTDNIKFATDIQPILTSSCTAPCHFSASTLGGGIILDGHSSIATAAKNGTLVGSIKHEGFSAMPKGLPKLDDCRIAKIEIWVKAGSPNN